MSFTVWLEKTTFLINQPLLSLGNFHLTLGKIAGLAILLLMTQGIVWIIDRGLKRLSHPDRHVVLSKSGSYALSRILRYLIWAIIAFIALDYLGINLSSLDEFSVRDNDINRVVCRYSCVADANFTDSTCHT